MSDSEDKRAHGRCIGNGKDRITWFCQGCGDVIKPARATRIPVGDKRVSVREHCNGYITISQKGLSEYKSAERRFNELLQQKRGARRLVVISIAEFCAAAPDPVRWTPYHAGCDPEPESGDYWIAIERLSTPFDVIEVTAHLSTKAWLEYTDWTTDLFAEICQELVLELTKTERYAILQRDEFQCQYCGRKAPDVELHVDHKVPRSKGGTNDASNLVTACLDCNIGKGDREL